jgi:hypothetical protein
MHRYLFQNHVKITQQQKKTIYKIDQNDFF